MSATHKGESLREKAYEYIKHRIVTCEIPPGAPIIEKELMHALGVSRTPIREAFSKLEKDKLVVVYPKRGIFVTNITMKDVIDIFTIRSEIEALAARLAAPRIDEGELTRFQTLFSSAAAETERGGPDGLIEGHIMIDREFHGLIARSVDNQYLEHIVLNLYDQNDRIRYYSKKRSLQRVIEARGEHLSIIGHFLARDAAAAEKAMREHVAHGLEAAVRVL